MAKHECEEALDRLFEYIDGELTPSELEHVAAHLKECPPCEAEHKLNEKIKSRVAKTGGATRRPDDDYDDRDDDRPRRARPSTS